MTTDPPDEGADPRWLMSTAADGECDAVDLARGCGAWADADSPARRSWHLYHLIGDVLRSGDLASPPGRDQAFLERLRERLADEPALPLSHSHAADRPGRRRTWALPAGLAAGVAALASGWVLMQTSAGGGSVAPLTALGPRAASAVLPDRTGQPVALEAAPQSGPVVRDAQLDRYLRAHREYGAALPGSLPGGPGRSISTVSLER